MLIQKIKIINFQKHKKLNLEFKRPLTVIMGPSSCGKSAIIKSMRAVLLNDFPARSIKKGTKSSTIILNNIERRRTKSGTGHYKIGDKKYTKIGKKIPNEVLKVSDINFIDQFNQHYFIRMSPGDRAKLLYKIAGLENVNEILEKAKNELNEVKTELRYKKKYSEKLKRELIILNSFDFNINQLEKLEDQISLLKKLKEIKFRKVPTLNVNLNKLKSLEQQTALLRRLNKIRIPKPIDFSELEVLYSQYNEILNKRQLLTKLKSIKYRKVPELKVEVPSRKGIDILKKMIKLKRLIAEYQLSENDLKDQLNEIGVCPMCGQEVSSWK